LRITITKMNNDNFNDNVDNNILHFYQVFGLSVLPLEVSDDDNIICPCGKHIPEGTGEWGGSCNICDDCWNEVCDDEDEDEEEEEEEEENQENQSLKN
jgi:hypothetical protein